jgi:DNA-binding response OmpR family regulator
MYTAYLEYHGVTVHSSNDTIGALALAAKVDAVVMAGRLPSERAALRFVEQLRAAPATKELPILMLSASGSSHDAARAADAGCDCFVTIPCAPDDLLWTVRRVIARRWFKTPRMIRFVDTQSRSAPIAASA